MVRGIGDSYRNCKNNAQQHDSKYFAKMLAPAFVAWFAAYASRCAHVLQEPVLATNVQPCGGPGLLAALRTDKNMVEDDIVPHVGLAACSDSKIFAGVYTDELIEFQSVEDVEAFMDA